MLSIDIYTDHVVVEGVRIDRPRRLSISQWMRVWERLKWKVK